MANKKKTGGSRKRNHEPAAVRFGKDKKRGGGPKKRLNSNSTNLGDGSTRLNKFIAHAGVCSRREADELIQLGSITVNGKIITEMGFKIKTTDIVKHEGETLSNNELFYIAINKPKNFNSACDNPLKERTVGRLVNKSTKYILAPIGKLERDSMGILILTNDNDLFLKLSNPKHEFEKIFQLELDKPLSQEDLDKTKKGIRLPSGGWVKAESLSYLKGNQHSIGIEIYNNKPKILEKMFDVLGYKIKKLDRVSFAGITKKNLSRGEYRKLSDAEIVQLKMLG
jgi:23S rRNA pseudouridine2605 synthase